MKLVSKSVGAINATSPLIDFEYLGKFEAWNELEMLPHTAEKSQFTNWLYVVQF